MDEVFFNVALAKGYFNKIEDIRNIVSTDYHSIDENYLLYYFDDFVYLDENIVKRDLQNMLLCANIRGKLLEDCFLWNVSPKEIKALSIG